MLTQQPSTLLLIDPYNGQYLLSCSKVQFLIIHPAQYAMAAKVIILTGASRGIGLAIAHYLLKESHKLVVVARTAAPLEELKKQYPGQVEVLAADLADFSVCCEISCLVVLASRFLQLKITSSIPVLNVTSIKKV